jgi:hypothetical protein
MIVGKFFRTTFDNKPNKMCGGDLGYNKDL